MIDTNDRGTRRIAMISMHTSPVATLGGKETGGMNVYVRELSRELAQRGMYVDVFTRSQNPKLPRVDTESLGVDAQRARVILIPAGPEAPYSKHLLINHVDEFAAGILAFAEKEGLRYDLLHAHYWLSGVAARRLQADWHSVPIVQMFHTLGAMKNRVARDEGERETQARIATEGELMRTVTRVIASTPRDK